MGRSAHEHDASVAVSARAVSTNRRRAQLTSVSNLDMVVKSRVTLALWPWSVQPRAELHSLSGFGLFNYGLSYTCSCFDFLRHPGVELERASHLLFHGCYIWRKVSLNAHSTRNRSLGLTYSDFLALWLDALRGQLPRVNRYGNTGLSKLRIRFHYQPHYKTSPTTSSLATNVSPIEVVLHALGRSRDDTKPFELITRHGESSHHT